MVISLCRIEFQDGSPFNTHPVPRAMFSAAVLIVITKIPDRLCHILFFLCCSDAFLNGTRHIMAQFDHLINIVTLLVRNNSSNCFFK